MRKFSIAEAGFSGYRLLASKPGLAVAWLLFSLVVAVVSIAALVWMAGPQMTTLRQIQEAGPGSADPATMMELSRQIMGYNLFSMVFTWFVGAISFAAVARAMLGRGNAAVGYLGFGGDELRLLVTTLVTGLLLTVLAVVTVVVAVIALAVGAGAGALRGGLANAGSAALPALVIGLVGFAAVVFLAIKLSLAPAQTVTDKGIRIFSSWTLTKGNFWPILGAYVLALLPVVVGWAISIAVLAAVNPHPAAGGGLQAFLRSLQPDVSSMGAAFQPAYLVSYLVGAVVRTLSMAGLVAPGVFILGKLASSPADAFDDDEED